jgi:hypothetical protein
VLEQRLELTGVLFAFHEWAAVEDPIPDGAGITFVNDFEPRAINSGGEAAFIADISSGGEGVFLAEKGPGIQTLALSGQAAPGGGTYSFGGWSPVGMNAAGDVVFPFVLDGANPDNPTQGTGLFSYSHATQTVSLVVIPHVTPAPGGGAFLGINQRAVINNRGDIAFAGLIDTTVPADVLQGNGVFLASGGGSITMVAAPGDTVPGGMLHYAWNPSINARGDAAFEGSLTGALYQNGVYLEDVKTGQISVIARAGDPIPASAGGTFDNVWGPAMNASGDIVFTGAVRGTSGPFGDGQGIFMESKGRIIAVARPSDSMPGGGTFQSSSFYVTGSDLSDSGTAVFAAILDGGDQGVYSWSNGTLSLVARTGTVIPGVGTVQGVLDAGAFYPFGTRVNDRGEVFFTAKLQGTGDGGSDVLFVATPAGRRRFDAVNAAAVGGGDAASNRLAPASPPVDQALAGMTVRDAINLAMGFTTPGKKKSAC